MFNGLIQFIKLTKSIYNYKKIITRYQNSLRQIRNICIFKNHYEIVPSIDKEIEEMELLTIELKNLKNNFPEQYQKTQVDLVIFDIKEMIRKVNDKKYEMVEKIKEEQRKYYKKHLEGKLENEATGAK